MSPRMSAISLMALASCLGACATSGGASTSVTPTSKVALADRQDSVYRAIAVSDVAGAPEIGFFGDMPWSPSKLPSQATVGRMVGGWLADADMLAPDLAHARYLLKISFDGEPAGEPVAAPAKAAKAPPLTYKVTYTLLDSHTGEPVLEKTYAPDAAPAAPRDLVAASFNDFVHALDEAAMLRIRRAVPCDMVDPGRGYGPAVIRKTPDAVGFDCPVSPRV